MMEPLLTGLALEKDMMAAPKETVSKKYGWDCGAVNRQAIVDATVSVLERMDELAALIDVLTMNCTKPTAPVSCH